MIIYCIVYIIIKTQLYITVNQSNMAAATRRTNDIFDKMTDIRLGRIMKHDKGECHHIACITKSKNTLKGPF